MAFIFRYRCNLHVNPYKPSVFYGALANNAEPDQTTQNAASNQVPLYLITTHQPLYSKWIRPIDKGGEFH